MQFLTSLISDLINKRDLKVLTKIHLFVVRSSMKVLIGVLLAVLVVHSNAGNYDK